MRAYHMKIHLELFWELQRVEELNALHTHGQTIEMTTKWMAAYCHKRKDTGYLRLDFHRNLNPTTALD